MITIQYKGANALLNFNPVRLSGDRSLVLTLERLLALWVVPFFVSPVPDTIGFDGDIVFKRVRLREAPREYVVDFLEKEFGANAIEA